MGGCMSSDTGEANPQQPRPDVQNAYMLAEQYFEQRRSLRAQERSHLNRVLLNSRVEHDNSAGSSAVEPTLAPSESGRSGSELECRSVAASQASALEQHNPSASLGRASATSARSGAPLRSNSVRSVESEARREKRRQERLRREEEELAMALAVSASEAEAVAQAMEEPISLDDARAIAEAQAELDRSVAAAAAAAAAGKAEQQDSQPPQKHRHRAKQQRGGRGEEGAAVRRSRSSNSACETIREEGEIQPADDDGQPRRSLTLRDRYTTTVAVPREFTAAELAAYERIQAIQHGGAAEPVKRTADSDSGSAIHRSDDTAYAGSVGRSSPLQPQTLDYIAECEQKLGQLSGGRRCSLERQAKQQQALQQREQELEDQLRSSSRAWRQTSLGDSAYEPAGKGLPQMQAPRGFMCA